MQNGLKRMFFMKEKTFGYKGKISILMKIAVQMSVLSEILAKMAYIFPFQNILHLFLLNSSGCSKGFDPTTPPPVYGPVRNK